MGAEHSIVRNTHHAGGPDPRYKLASRRKGKQNSSAETAKTVFDHHIDLDDFLKEKETEFYQLLDQRTALATDAVSLHLAHTSIETAMASRIDHLNEQCLEITAHAIAWQAISIATLDLVHSPKTMV